MSFFEKLAEWQSRSEEQRRRLTFFWSAGITVVVAVIWVFSLNFTLQAPTTSQVAAVGVITATSSEENFLVNNKVKIIEGWKVITNR